MEVLLRLLRGLLEVVSGLGGVISAAEGVAWDQERMDMAALEEEVVLEGVGTLAKVSFPPANGEEARGYLRVRKEDGDMVEGDLEEAEVDTKEFKGNDTILQVDSFTCWEPLDLK
jgi:hypothetical protein